MDTGLGERYSRHSFEKSPDREGLARDLAELLTERLRKAGDAGAEASAIVADLKLLGHELFSWDESLDFQIWGDDYVRPGLHRMVVELRFADEDFASVSVDFGPWPSLGPPDAPTLCPRCQTPMAATTLRVRAVGHGHVASREVEVEVLLGEQDRRTFTAGQRSEGLQVWGLCCSTCRGLWLPDTSRIESTG